MKLKAVTDTVSAHEEESRQLKEVNASLLHEIESHKKKLAASQAKMQKFMKEQLTGSNY